MKKIVQFLTFVAFALAPATLPAQTDVRAYRAPNHIVMAARLLQPNQPWNGSFYEDGKDKYAILSWGSSCAVSKDGFLLTANHVVSGGEKYLVGGWADTAKLGH